MIEGLQPYSEYKESGSKWLGKAPAHWEAVPLGRLLVQRIEQNRPIKTKDILSLSLRQGVIPYSEKKSGGNKAKDDLTAYNLAYPGDIVLNSMNVVVGSVGLSKYFGAVSPVYYVLNTRNKRDSICYFDALFQDKTFQQSLWGLGNGILFLQSKTTGKFNTIRMRIPMGSLRRVVIPHPEPDEQVAIVRFLEHANRKIDGFIRAKRKLIGLLNEQKLAIIHRAVTRGLDPHAPLKPSGIPWLGDIPKHWEVIPLKYLSRRIQNGSTPPSDQPQYFENGTIPWFGPASITTALEVGPPTKRVTERAERDGKARVLKAPALLIVVIGTVGKMALLQQDGATNQQITGFELREKMVNPRFLTLQLKFAEPWLKAAASSATIPILDSGVLNRSAVAVPPAHEQQSILIYIENATGPSDTAIARTEREIALMQEYRTRLTADVVTGKLDVRPAAAKLPKDSVQEPLEDLLEEPEQEAEE